MASLIEKWADELPIAFIIIVVTWSLWKYITTPKNLPPGPWGLPIFGYLPFLGKKRHITLTNLSKKYGDVFIISTGRASSLVLSSYDVLKEALVKQADVFSARPNNSMLREFKNIPGILRNNGKQWAEFRRFSLSTLKDFGLGKTTFEPQLMEEVQRFLEVVGSSKGEPIEMGGLLQKSVVNVICTLISGRRMEYDSPLLNELLQLTNQQISASGVGKLRDAIPTALRTMGVVKYLGLKRPLEAIFRMLKILREIVDKHDEKHVSGSQDNFIDCWLTELEKQRGNTSSYMNKQQLPSVLRDLFLAGSDTTANSLTWAFLYMAKYEDIQKKVQHEIDEVIGRERNATMSDLKSMPYTEAVLMELSRMTSIVPLSLLHCVTKDTILKGYFIPKGLEVIPNLWAVHHDPNTFPNPDEFKPERFLGADQQVKRMEELVPFSMGKRQCMGEALARMELFLFFTSMLQQFTIRKVDGEDVDFDHHYAVISVPNPQKLRAIPRI